VEFNGSFVDFFIGLMLDLLCRHYVYAALHSYIPAEFCQGLW